MENARILEIFSSYQGEGKYLGVRQIFLRFSGCELNCLFCDTRRAKNDYRWCYIETTPGSQKFKKIKNPLSLIQLEKMVLDFNEIFHHSLSLTGGEPLLQADFLKNFLPKIKKRKIKIYLETNGIHYKNLRKILPWIDIISMDIKLPSVSGEFFFKEHYDFLKAAYLKELFIKIVVNSKLSLKELEEAGRIIKKVNPKILVFIQPDYKEKLNIKELNIFYNILTKFVKEVRIVPQIHKFLKIN